MASDRLCARKAAASAQGAAHPDVRPAARSPRGMLAGVSERPTGEVPAQAVLPWAFAAAAILTQQVGSRAVRDALFLSRVSAAELPRAMLAAAVISVPV